MEIVNTLGRRKAAIARIYVGDGNGKIIVNKKDYKEFFPISHLHKTIESPLQVVEAIDKYDIKVNVCGGGVKGQAEAVQLAIARALIEIDPESRPALKAKGLLHRDPRVVERKKPGQKKARKKFQFSKR